jgi:hypothetical protein
MNKFLFAITVIPALAFAAAQWVNEVRTVEKDNMRVMESNGIADHRMGDFPRRGNPNSISPQRYQFKMTLNPVVSAEPVRSGPAFFGVAVNGVPFEPGTGEFWRGDRQWNYEAMTGHLDLGLDDHHAHVQPTGAYHYHGLPTGLIEILGGDKKKMLLLGHAADGFPIYASMGHAEAKDAKSPLREMKSSWRLRKGSRPEGEVGPGGKYDGTFSADFEFIAGSGDLDECNGRFGVTPEHPDGIYHYHITTEYPFMGRYWRGTPDSSFFKQGPPGGGGGPGGPPRRGRKGGPGFGPPPF